MHNCLTIEKSESERELKLKGYLLQKLPGKLSLIPNQHQLTKLTQKPPGDILSQKLPGPDEHGQISSAAVLHDEKDMRRIPLEER